MDSSHISSIISAAAGITGVLLGNSFVAIKESLKDRKKDERDSAYLAILVVSHLERFANGCWGVALDDGTSEGMPAGRDREYHAPTVSAPEFSPLEIKVEWKVLPKDLMHEILRIPDTHERLQNRLGGLWDFSDAPDYTDYFWTRQHDYAELGLHVSATANKLRKFAGMPIEETPAGEWNRETSLKEVIAKIDSKRAAHGERQRKMMEQLNAQNPETLL